MPLDPLVLACFACLCALHTMSVNILTSPTSTMMTGLVVPLPPLFKSLNLPLMTIYVIDICECRYAELKMEQQVQEGTHSLDSYCKKFTLLAHGRHRE